MARSWKVRSVVAFVDESSPLKNSKISYTSAKFDCGHKRKIIIELEDGTRNRMGGGYGPQMTRVGDKGRCYECGAGVK